MLYFNLKDTGEQIEVLSLENIQWLSKFHVIKQGSTGFLENDGVETLPFFDDYEITYDNAVSMYNFSNKTIIKMKSDTSFKSEAIDKFCNILKTIMQTKKSLQVICS